MTRTDRRRLLQRLAFRELRHFSWDTFLPIPWPMTGHDHQFFNELLCSLVTSTLFVRSYCLIARKLAVLFGFNHGIRPFYAACCFNELRRGSVLSLLTAIFEKRFHNATTRFFAPKLMTVASAGAILGE